jgi:hypothetical protein
MNARLLVVVVIILIGAISILFMGKVAPQSEKPVESVKQPLVLAAPPALRPIAKLAPSAEPELSPEKGEDPTSQDDGNMDLKYGDRRGVPADSSTQAQSVVEALKSGNQPQRLSTLFASETFDREKYEKDPDAYLKVSEPARVFECAQPGPEVPAMRAASDTLVRLAKRDETTLSVAAAPSAPVTFTSFDLGSFKESKLPTVTVKANEKGMATVTFVASAGAVNDVHILAGSPMASGQARFTVVIEDAESLKQAK